jgi:hypothetical protein
MMHDRCMSEPKVTTFRFTDEELEVLGMIEGHTGIRSRTEALKGVLREHTQPVEPGGETKQEAPASEGERPDEGKATAPGEKPI